MTPEEIALAKHLAKVYAPSDEALKAGLMKCSKNVLAARIIELTRICDKETTRADKSANHLLITRAQQAAYWLLDCHEGSAPRLLGEELQAAINFNDSIPAQQNQNNPRPTATD